MDEKDNEDIQVNSGVYFYQTQTKSFSSTKKMLMIQ